MDAHVVSGIPAKKLSDYVAEGYDGFVMMSAGISGSPGDPCRVSFEDGGSVKGSKGCKATFGEDALVLVVDRRGDILRNDEGRNEMSCQARGLDVAVFRRPELTNADVVEMERMENVGALREIIHRMATLEGYAAWEEWVNAKELFDAIFPEDDNG